MAQQPRPKNYWTPQTLIAEMKMLHERYGEDATNGQFLRNNGHGDLVSASSKHFKTWIGLLNACGLTSRSKASKEEIMEMLREVYRKTPEIAVSSTRLHKAYPALHSRIYKRIGRLSEIVEAEGWEKPLTKEEFYAQATAEQLSQIFDEQEAEFGDVVHRTAWWATNKFQLFLPAIGRVYGSWQKFLVSKGLAEPKKADYKPCGYYSNMTDEQLQSILKQAVEEHGEKAKSMGFSGHGGLKKVAKNRFGSWPKFVESCGFKSPGSRNENHRHKSKQQLIDEFHDYVKKYGKDVALISTKLGDKGHNGFVSYVGRVFGGWCAFVTAAGFTPVTSNPVFRRERLQELDKQLTAELVDLVRSLEQHIHELPMKAWLAILRASKAFRTAQDPALTPVRMKLLSGEITPADIIELIDQPQESDSPDLPAEAPVAPRLEEMLAAIRTDAHQAPSVEEEPVEDVADDDDNRRNYLLNLAPQRVLNTVTATAKAATDEATLNFIAHEASERFWARALRADDPQLVAAEVEAAVPEDKWAALVRDRFLEDWSLIENLGSIPGFTPSPGFTELNLMQRREAALLRRDRRRLNTSGMGAGKTDAALAAIHACGCQRVLVLCPNNAINSWVEPLQLRYPAAAVATKTWEPQFPAGRPQFLINNHEMMSDYGLRRLAELVVAFEPDAICVDELHQCKVRSMGTESQRHRNLKALLDDFRERGAVIYGMTGTPVVNELAEAVSLLEMVDPSAAKNLGTKPTVDNCLAVHEALQPLTSRFVPQPPCRVLRSTISVRADALLDDVVVACQRSVTTADAVMSEVKLPSLVRLAAEPGKLVVFTSAVTGVVDEARAALERAGIWAVVHTGEEKGDADCSSVDQFLTNPSVKVLIASSATLATGFDGLQKVCHRVAFLTLPWTAAEHDQAVARVVRQGTAFDSVEITYLEAVLSDPISGEDWSLDRQKTDRLTGKRTIADAVCDGVIPDRAALQLTLPKVRRGAKRWADNIAKHKNAQAAISAPQSVSTEAA